MLLSPEERARLVAALKLAHVEDRLATRERASRAAQALLGEAAEPPR